MKLNMGGHERFTPGYTSIGFGAQINVDVTKTLPVADCSVDFLWSERMLEHISVSDNEKVISNISKILKKGASARFCMPSCFYCDNKSIDMMRANNYQKQVKLGHVTWFTYEGIGNITENLFGLKDSPEPSIKLKDLFEKYNMEFKLIRWHDKNSKLYYDKNLLSNPIANTFIDRPEIVIHRPNSLIFEGIKK